MFPTPATRMSEPLAKKNSGGTAPAAETVMRRVANGEPSVAVDMLVGPEPGPPGPMSHMVMAALSPIPPLGPTHHIVQSPPPSGWLIRPCAIGTRPNIADTTARA